jgi:hypothetical protein
MERSTHEMKKHFKKYQGKVIFAEKENTAKEPRKVHHME